MKWEYRTIKYNKKISFWNAKIDYTGFDKKLNTLGVQGWELVSSTTLQGWGASSEIIASFKREVR